MDKTALHSWYYEAKPSLRGRLQHYSDTAMTRALMLKRIFGLTLRALQGFVDSIFKLMKVPLNCPDYTCISKRSKSVSVPFKTTMPGEIAHLVIKHGQGEWRFWLKRHLAVDTETHEVICADLSLSNVTDTEAFSGLIRQPYRKVKAASADVVHDRRVNHDELRRKKIRALIPPRSVARYWSADYADRNQAVANQLLTGDNTRTKSMTCYPRRIAETAMYRVQQLCGGHLSLRDYQETFYSKFDLFNNAPGQCSSSSGTPCTLWVLRAARIQTSCTGIGPK
ncbi:MAG: transposase [Serratia symbiotica]|nr:transposase [Serratia symbiotica]